VIPCEDKKLAYCKKCGTHFPDRRVTRQKKGEYESRLDHLKKCYNIYNNGTQEQLLKIYMNFFQPDPLEGGETEEAEIKRTVKAWKNI